MKSRQPSTRIARLDRRMAFSVLISDREIYLSPGSENLTGAVIRIDARAHGRGHPDEAATGHSTWRVLASEVFSSIAHAVTAAAATVSRPATRTRFNQRRASGPRIRGLDARA